MDTDIPEILLVVAGILALLIVHEYRKDKESGLYVVLQLLGVLAGLAMIVVTATNYTHWSFLDSVLIIIAGFALVIRPFRDVDFAILISVVIMIVAYVYLGGLTGDFATLGQGYYRIGIAIVAGAFVYMILHFIDAVAKMIGKFLNLWPVLFVLGLICLIEGIMIMAGGDTLIDYIETYQSQNKTFIAMLGY